jgi:hypothetical protein
MQKFPPNSSPLHFIEGIYKCEAGVRIQFIQQKSKDYFICGIFPTKI